MTGEGGRTAAGARLIEAAIRLIAPDLAREVETARHVRQLVRPRDVGQRDSSPHVPGRLIGCAGVDLRLVEQLERLGRWRDAYPRVFADLRSDPRINTQCRGKPYVHNGTYPTPDAEIYAAMILDFRPRSIVEIGAGFSTRIARHAARRLSEPCSITVIDPEPRTDVSGEADEVVLRPVEDVDASALAPGTRSLLFIDSTHVTRPGGDIPYLYNVIVPSLPAGTIVHVHDIFLPYDYPVDYQERLYTEQYVLHALLAHAERYRVLFASHWMSREHSDAVRATFGDVVAREDPFYGAAFWFMVQ